MGRYRRLLLALGIPQLLVMTLSSGPGADISLSRQSFLVGENSDFLGIFAGWFYSLIPNQPFGWGINMTFIQMTCVIIAFQVGNFRSQSARWALYLYPIAQYLALYFSAQQSRDGALFAFLFLGLSILRKFPHIDSKNKRNFLISISLIFIIFGLCFRPWMSILALPLILFIFKEITKTLPLTKSVLVLFIFMSTITPLSLEYGMLKLLDVKRDYPLQTLLIHDLATAACWSANIKTSEASLIALEKLSVSQDLPSSICQFYKPNTWQAVTAENTQSRLTRDLNHPLSITDSPKVYARLVQDWISILANDPKTYIQNKLMLSSQVYLASQTKIPEIRNFVVQSSDLGPLIRVAKGLVFLVDLPWKISSALFLLTPGVMLISYFLLHGISRRRKYQNRNLLIIPLMALLCTIWGAITFVSDNARYLTPFVILSYFSVLSSFQSKESEPS